MPFEINIADKPPEKGEDKRVEFVPRDTNGNPISAELQAIELTMTNSDGGTVVRSKGDFSRDGDKRYVMVPLDTAGEMTLELYGEGPQGFRERTDLRFIVKDN
jgi:hypothetical protein